MDVKLEPSPAVQDKNFWIIIKYHQNGEHNGIFVEYGARQWDSANINTTKREMEKIKSEWKHVGNIDKDFANIWDGIFNRGYWNAGGIYFNSNIKLGIMTPTFVYS